MKAYFLSLGAGGERSLPALLTAVSCGAVREIPLITMLRISLSAPGALSDSMMADLNACRRYFAGKDAFAFFRTAWDASCWQPRLPDRDGLAGGESGGLLLSALRGEKIPLSFRTDREAAEWAFSALTEAVPEDFSGLSGPSAEPFAPFLRVLSGIRKDLDAGEDVRVLLFCDSAEASAAGMALGILRFLRSRFADPAPYIGLIGQFRSAGAGARDDLSALRDFLSALRDRNLLRPSEERDTGGADAFWLLGLPSGLLTSEDAGRILDWESARVMGEFFDASRRPSPGLHTREIPGILTLQSLDQEAKPAAAFLRGSFWCLCDLFPALHAYFDHPALLRSLAPATRGGLFRRLFRDAGEPEEFAVVERTMRAMLLEILSLLRTLPAPLREAEASSALWQEAVRACGRVVTLGSEYAVARKEAEESGVDKVAPVHRVSLTDTEEEELLRRLDTMSGDLAGLTADRAEVFRKLGGFRSRQALEDCLSRCRVAEVSAREKLALMPAGEPEERFALGLQERRLRMLSAAVGLCETDLEEISEPGNLSQPGTQTLSGPFAGEILDPALAEQGFLLLTAGGEEADAAAKALRSGLSGLLKGYPLNDVRMLLKNLISVCRRADAEAPLRGLLAGVFSVCGVEVSGLRFLSAGDLPAVPLLPDMREEGRFFSLSAAPERLLAPQPRDRTAETRGLLAFLILREYRRRSAEEAELCFFPCEKGDSALSRVWLSSRGVDRADLVCLRKEDGARLQPLAVLLPGVGLEPARLTGAGRDLFPSFALWLDRESMLFRDPCPFLGEGDRRILTERLTGLRAAMKDPRAGAFLDFLSRWHQDIVQAPRTAESGAGLRRRLRIACGLSRLPVWQKELRRTTAYYESSLPADPVCAGISGAPDFAPAAYAVREDILYTFRELPVARESAARLLESVRLPEEETLLSSLGAECALLLRSSDDYHEALAEGIRELLQRYPAAEPGAVQEARAVLEEALQPVEETETALTWPWDTRSASVLTILTECLGPELASAALQPFSDRLTLFPARGGEILGDHLLSSLCVLRRQGKPADAAGETAPAPDEGSGSPASATPETAGEDGSAPETPPEPAPDAALPPLSPDFARVLCRTPRGQSLIQDGFLSFEPESGGVRVTLTLEGAFTLRLIRVYSGEEQLLLYAHDMPTLAVWPSLPFAPEDWRAYFSYAHGPEDFVFTVLSPEAEAPLEGADRRWVLRTEGFPLCFLLTYRGLSAGAVPNLLPPPELPRSGDWTACLDFGAAATSVVLESGGVRWPMQGPVRMRTLLRNPASSDALLWREFLPAVPVTALLPGALRIFRNSLGDADLPFRDAAVFMSSSLRDVLEISPDALYTDLKWNGEKGRAGRLYLHQVMLMAALEARCGGASSLGWRASVPDEMAPEGRERLAALLRSVAEEVRLESGLPLPEKAPPAAFASESAALGSYFRFCAPDETRSGFMALDLGADTADLALFLRGRDQAVRACQLPLGVHNVLLPALLRRPAVLAEDFGFVEDGAFQQDLLGLRALLAQAARDPAALRQARYGLDAMTADYFPVLLQALATRRAEGVPGRTGALLLLHFSFLMMISGLTLLQISADPQKNDFLPESMTLFLAGRGSALMESLSLPVKTSLWKILTMFRNPRVSSLNLLFSAEKKMEIPVGLSVMRDVSASLPRPAQAPAAMALRPEELMPEFLARFLREFPAEAGLLFPGVFAANSYDPLTPYGRMLLSQAVQAAFGGRESGRPYPALTACLSHLLNMIQEESAL